jgi:hypothetical protein
MAASHQAGKRYSMRSIFVGVLWAITTAICSSAESDSLSSGIRVILSEELTRQGYSCICYDIIRVSTEQYLSPQIEVYVVLNKKVPSKLLLILGSARDQEIVGGEAQLIEPELQAGFKYKVSHSELHAPCTVYGARFLCTPPGIVKTISIELLRK